MKDFKISRQELKEYREVRRNKAMTPGSKWAFFRSGNSKDPWSSRTIVIVSAYRNDRGSMVLHARCPELEKPDDFKKGTYIRRRVYYKELW